MVFGNLVVFKILCLFSSFKFTIYTLEVWLPTNQTQGKFSLGNFTSINIMLYNFNSKGLYIIKMYLACFSTTSFLLGLRTMNTEVINQLDKYFRIRFPGSNTVTCSPCNSSLHWDSGCISSHMITNTSIVLCIIQEVSDFEVIFCVSGICSALVVRKSLGGLAWDKL